MDFQQNRPLRRFERSREEAAAEQYLQLVISASYDLLQKSRQEIIDLCLRKSATLFPPPAKPNC